jgi:hypothetical protein
MLSWRDSGVCTIYVVTEVGGSALLTTPLVIIMSQFCPLLILATSFSKIPRNIDFLLIQMNILQDVSEPEICVHYLHLPS